MKNRIKAILLATGLTVSTLCMGAYAGEASTEAATEAVTGAAKETEAEASAETEVAAAEEAVSEAASELTAEETAAEGTDGAAAGGKYAAYYDSMKTSVVQTLQALSDMTDEQVQAIIESGQNASEVAMAATWDSVREELGSFVEVTSQEVTEEKDVVTVLSVAKYDKIDENTPVNVSYVFDAKDGSASLKWEVKYPMSKLLEQAGLNTVMGIGIVFLALLFLSFLIGQLHWIPDMINKKEKAAAPAPAPKAAPAPVVEEEEELADDLELVAVITAAIAASENTSADGFVVRSIKKANRRKWQNA